jgi:hypothetical protein
MEKTWKAIVAELKLLSEHLPEGLMPVTAILSHNSKYSSRDLNRAGPEYKSETLPLERTCLHYVKAVYSGIA